MKRVLMAICVLASTAAFAQSHEAGNFTFNLGYELGISPKYYVEIDSYEGPEEDTDDYDTKLGALRVDAQYGISDLFSMGVLIRTGSYTNKFDLDDIVLGPSDFSLKTNYLDVGIEPRFHVLNKEEMNLFVAPALGTSLSSPDFDGGEKGAGLFIGVGAGFNYYFTDIIGATLRLGYTTRFHTYEAPVGGDFQQHFTGTRNLDLGIGVSAKF